VVRDLLVIVPSRGRPAAVAELRKAVRAMSAARTDLIVAFDEDDPAVGGYRALRDATRKDRRVMWAPGPRRSLAGWTNRIAAVYGGRYRALCSMGDDHRPRTDGWDTALLAALDATGGTGIAYGDDLLQGSNLPTCPVISADIVAALGWMCLPSLSHFFVDDVWRVLGEQAGCLHYVPGVITEHLHWLRTGVRPDGTYLAAEAGKAADRAAYEEWLAGGQATDVATVKGLLAVVQDLRQLGQVRVQH
jgi:hypothetical protein